MRTETKWAIIVTLVMLVWMFIAKMLGFLTAEKYATGQIVGSIVSTVAFIITYYMVTKEKRDTELNGVMSWSEGFWTAARMTLIYIPISCFVFWIYLEYINPEYQTLLAADSYGKDPVSYYLMGNLWSSFLFGGLFCLIFPLFTRKSAQ
ncbi:MAG: DUF4199 domain-containing protein [Bacteroidetes bacterium]|nr:DUF4199 domain-containing protein [Bacteroidota bacterium]